MPDFTVEQRGLDTSGRAIYETHWFWVCWDCALEDPRLDSIRSKIVIVQGGFMTRNGGGATASAGYHDEAGCLDVRTWNLTADELDLFIYVMSDYGIQFWRRDLSYAHGGMDPHAHCIFPSDHPLAPGAALQATAVMNRRDGLAHNGADYERRVTPIKTHPSDAQLQGDPLMSDAAQAKLDKILSQQDQILARINKTAGNAADRDKKLRQQFTDMAATLGSVVDSLTELGNEVKDDASKELVQKVKTRILDALAKADDVDGADNPAPTA